MGTLIDSSVLIVSERGQLDLEALLAARAEEQFAISAITAYIVYPFFLSW